MPGSPFSHLDDDASPRMVDVGGKEATTRAAVAETIIELPEEVLRALDRDDLRTAKGSVFDIANLAGVQAAKKTSELIPLCHLIPLESVKLDLRREGADRIVVTCRAKATHKTGVEMEALVGATAAALTVYDMCKALSPEIVLRETKLIEKTGGTGDYRRKDPDS
mgnify:CR=1 FL=1